MIIKRATPDDATTLHEVAAETFPLACPPDTLPEAIADFIATKLSVEAFDTYLADPERELFLAWVDGEPAGYTMLVFGEPTDDDVLASVTVRPVAELSKVYARPKFHGQGVAQELVKTSVEAARLRGAKGLWLGVNQINGRANAFYEKSGFATVGTKKFLVGQRWEDDFIRLMQL